MLHKRTRLAAAVSNSFAFALAFAATAPVLAGETAQDNPSRPDRTATSDQQFPSTVVGQAAAPDNAKSPPANTKNINSTPEAVLSEVAVTATRSEKALEKIPGAVNVISQTELAPQWLIAEDPSQALSTFVPGYSPSRQKMTSFGESLRGRKALILFDGIPQSNPLRDGAREGYFADPAVIERIEVVNGPSAIQGMGATGGIINFISKTPKKLGTEHRFDAKLSSQFKDDSLTWKTGYLLSHKNARFDVLGYAGLTRRGMAYDGDGRRIGMDTTQGDTMDSAAHDLFIKAGTRWGRQRVQFSANRFAIEGDGDYRAVAGNRALGVPTTSQPGKPPGNPPRNRVQTLSLDWQHNDLAGGAATAQLYKQDFSASYGAGTSPVFQDPAIAPAGTLVDQSEIVADKWGLRTSWLRPDFLVRNLELTAGIDWLSDTSKQRLALTGRTWVPPLEFTSVAPFLQLEYEIGPVTLRGGARRENAELRVGTYQTLAAYGSRSVAGGTLAFTQTVKNLGAIWRFSPGWSVFASYNEGFGLPDVGLVLRGINSNGRSVNDLIDLKPVITDNREVGLAWRGVRGNFGLSYYESSSDLGSQIRVVNGIGRVDRVPVEVKGWELNGEARLADAWKLFALYSTIDGKTAVGPDQPLDVDLGSRSQGPDKLVLGVDWAFSQQGNMRLQAARYFSRQINSGRTSGSARLDERFDGYAVADLAVSYKSAWGDLGFGVENLFDKQYIGYFPQANPGGTQDDYFAGRGRTYTVSYARTF